MLNDEKSDAIGDILYDEKHTPNLYHILLLMEFYSIVLLQASGLFAGTLHGNVIC